MWNYIAKRLLLISVVIFGVTLVSFSAMYLAPGDPAEVIAFARYGQDLSSEQSEKLPALIHAVNDVERIGDHAENLVELAQMKLDEKVKFSKKAAAETQKMYGLVDSMFAQTIEALRDNDPEKAFAVIETEEKVNKLDKKLRNNHIDRLKSKKCKVPAGVIFLDMLTNFEKIGDHLTNIAQAVGDALQWNGVRIGKGENGPGGSEPARSGEPAESSE